MRVRMSLNEQKFPGHGSSGAVSRPGAAARRGIIPDIGILSRSYPGFVPSHYLFENLPLIVFQKRHEQDMAHGAHCLFQNRPMSDFHIKNVRSRGSFRYLGRRAISPTQTFRAAGIWIFSTQTFFGSFEGGRCDAKYRFSKRRSELAGSKIFEGGDLNENGNCKKENTFT